MDTRTVPARKLANQGLVAAVGGAVWLVVALALLALGWYERQEQFERVRERNVLLARVLADHATRSIDGTALATATVEELLTRGIAPEGPEMRAALAQTLVNLPFLRGMAVVDARGLVVGSADATELNHVIPLARLGLLPTPGRDALGPLLPGRRLLDLATDRGVGAVPQGVGFLPLLRATVAPGGQLMVVVALINVDALVNFQQTTLGDTESAAGLLSYSGQLVGATRNVARRAGDNLATLPPFVQFLPSQEHGGWMGAGLRSGEQLAAFRVSRTWPLVVLVEFGAAEAHAQWWRASRGLVGAGAAALLFIAAMTLLAARSLRARDRAQAAVVQREHELAITLQSLQELVFRCDAGGVLSFVNAQWVRATGAGEAESIGRPLADWVPPRERAAVVALFDASAGPRVRHGRVVLADAAGLPRSYDLSVMPLQEAGRLTGFAGSAVDVTERVQAQRRLEQQLAFGELLLESSPLPMSVMSRERRYLIVNKAWEAFTGRTRDTVIGHEVGAHLATAERRLHEQHDEQVYATQDAVRYDTRLVHADGTLRDVVIEKRALPGDDGQPAGILAVVIDVTEFREAERATREARDTAEEASRAKSEFIANISHELRTPLQSIIGFSELGLRRAGDQARLAAMFTDIHASGQRMLALVNDLLDVSRLESTVGTIHLERTDLRRLVREVLRELEPLAAQRQVALVARLSEAPMRAKVDPLRFQQVVRNVVANALKFSPAGAAVEIEGDATPQGCWRIAVADRGPGIPEAELERVFEAFVQSSLTKDGSGGTGLGLAICRKIVQAHGGSIHAEPREGGGSLFLIELPGGAAETMPASL
jgi:PAS domain S-box-containing protein